jgi:uncharacterized membrane protein
MKILGHPLHMMLIHFPKALLPMDVLFSFFAYYNNDRSILEAEFYCLAAGFIMGGLAIITGLIDAFSIRKENKNALGTAILHGFVNGIVLIFFGIFAYKIWQVYPEIKMPGMATIVIKTALVIVLFGGNYLGGKLILQHHVGVKNKEL